MVCDPVSGLLVSVIPVINSGSCGEAEFQACQVAGSLPASRFTPASSPLELCIPAQLTAGTGQPKPPQPSPGSLPAQSLPTETAPPSAIAET